MLWESSAAAAATGDIVRHNLDLAARRAYEFRRPGGSLSLVSSGQEPGIRSGYPAFPTVTPREILPESARAHGP